MFEAICSFGGVNADHVPNESIPIKFGPRHKDGCWANESSSRLPIPLMVS